MQEHQDYTQAQEDEHGWYNPAVTLCLYIASIGAIAGISLLAFIVINYAS